MREAARLEAFSDGVMAVIITIMAFGLNVPRDTTWHAVARQLPPLLVYLLSFTLIGVYWNNHHHLFRVTHRISGAVMWTNLHLLFWLSLIPVATKWVGQAHQANDLGVAVPILPRPVEIPQAVPFQDDTVLRPYDHDAAHRFWLALVQASRVMGIFRSRFIGNVSLVHFFWGAADLAVTRFSGRTAPKHPGGVPNCPDWVQQLAHSHEVSSCGFWPGGSEEGSFYAYAYPTPEGFAAWPVRPPPAYLDEQLGEYILPYQAVRTAVDPDSSLLEFFQTTYEAAATLAGWDRAALETASAATPDPGLEANA